MQIFAEANRLHNKTCDLSVPERSHHPLYRPELNLKHSGSFRTYLRAAGGGEADLPRRTILWSVKTLAIETISGDAIFTPLTCTLGFVLLTFLNLLARFSDVDWLWSGEKRQINTCCTIDGNYSELWVKISQLKIRIFQEQPKLSTIMFFKSVFKKRAKIRRSSSV